jgi:hypothetical protein
LGGYIWRIDGRYEMAKCVEEVKVRGGQAAGVEGDRNVLQL